MSEPPQWMGSQARGRLPRLELRTLYRLIDDGKLPAYKFGRVMRIKQEYVEAFIEAARVEPGTLKHLYPESRKGDADEQDDAVAE